jgi:ATP-dependent Lon protease
MGTKNGILFFDEFDKASERKEIMSTLLHITDFSQNNEFKDNYFPEFCQDLSKIWFIYSMNELPKDPAILDRLEIIKVDGYSFVEKKIIAKEYLFPKFSNELNITDNFEIEEDALNKLIGLDNSEGVRDLERSINLLMEKIYFYLHNKEIDYEYEWFKKMSMRNDKVIINEELIDLILKKRL